MSALPDISNVAASSSPDKVILVAPVIAPLSAIAPLISIVVAAICTSVSATISNCPSVDELIYKAESLKRSLLVLFKVKPVPSVCVKVVSESAPNFNTAESDPKIRSFGKVTSELASS